MKTLLLFILIFSNHALAKTLADLILYNADIRTFDSHKTRADSLAVAKGKIVFIGSQSQALRYAGKNTIQTDLKKQLVLPGFIDSHMHAFIGAINRELNYLIQDSSTTQSMLAEIKKYLQENPEKNAIEISGYDRGRFISEFQAGPTKKILDDIDSSRPIFVFELNMHSAWVNSKALELAGITSQTKDPVNGVIERLPGSNEPSGQLFEEAAYQVLKAFPIPTDDEIGSAFLRTQTYFAKLGLTTIHDMFPAFTQDRQIAMHRAANQLAKNHKLTVRVLSSWGIDPADGNPLLQMQKFAKISGEFKDPNFRVRSFKFMIDGTGEQRSALLLKPYCDNIAVSESDCKGSYYGEDVWKNARVDLAKAYALANQLKFQVHSHTIGDGAVRRALDAMEIAHVSAEMKPSLEHLQLADAKDVQRMGRMGVTANVSPLWMGLDSYFSNFYYPYFGFDRAYNHTYPYQSLYDAHVNVTMASDWTVTEPDVPFQFYTAMTRLYPQRIYEYYYGSVPDYEHVHPYSNDLKKIYSASDFDVSQFFVVPIGPLGGHRERAKTLAQVVESATINGAVANRIEKITGSLEVGKSADIVVLDTPIFEAEKKFLKTGLASDLEPVANSRVIKTYFEGRLVWDADLTSNDNRLQDL